MDNEKFDFNQTLEESEKIYQELTEKINDVEKKLDRLYRKFDIIEGFIAKLQDNLERTAPENFKARGQIQNSIARHISIQNELTDAIVKFEKLIQDYQKMRLDVQNNKVANYIKWKASKKEEKDQSELQKIIEKFESDFLHLQRIPISPDNFGNLLDTQKDLAKVPPIEKLKDEIFDDEYKI